MRKIYCFSYVLVILIIFFSSVKNIFAQEKNKFWEVQSIDTMKFSRDLAREKKDNYLFENVIKSQIENLSSVGVTHVAIGTPYDEEFLPFLKKWVREARKNGLKIWFRSNLSGWEQWFGYEKISPEEHTDKVRNFILNNADLFEDGDIFTSCTECENGALGDPRSSVNLEVYRKFLIKEYKVVSDAFKQINKKVESNYYSMNADVARMVMDKETANSLGGLVVIDHYVKDPKTLAEDVRDIASSSGGKVVLGEIGAPIPDIHGQMTPLQQAKWLSEVLYYLSKEPSVYGINYWVANGGTTSLWEDNGKQKPAVMVLKSYFIPDILSGTVFDELGRPIKNALVIGDSKTAYTDNNGKFQIIKSPLLERIILTAPTFKETAVLLNSNMENIVMFKENPNILYKILVWFNNLFKIIKLEFRSL